MRILIVNKYHKIVGGADRYALGLAELLAKHGHDVAFAAPDFSDNLRPDYPLYAIPAGLTTRNWNAVSRGLQVKAFLDGLYNFAAGRVVRDAVRDFRPDLVHCQNIFYQLSPSVIRAAHAAGIPVVQTLHDCFPVCANTALRARGRICEECRGGRFHHILKNRCYNDSLPASVLAFSARLLHTTTGLYPRSIDRFVSPSLFLKEKIESFRQRMAPIDQVNNFLDATAFKPNAEPGAYLLFFGQLIRHKGVFTLLEASRLCQTRIPLIIVGTGPLEQSIKEEIQRHGMSHVTLAGYKSGAELFGLIRDARLVVVPSECYENQPYAVLESFALGKPVIGSNLGGIPELIDPEVGCLFAPGDANDLARRLDELLPDDERLRRMGMAAREKVVKNHDPETHLARLLDVYERTLAAYRAK